MKERHHQVALVGGREVVGRRDVCLQEKGVRRLKNESVNRLFAADEVAVVASMFACESGTL